MSVVIAFIAFLIYASAIFFIKNYYLLEIVFAVNLILMIVFNVGYKKTTIFLIKLLPFITFTGVINTILGGIYLGMLISIRLILVCQVTYIFSERMTPKKIQYAVEKILIPLKLFKINTKEIGIIVAISISFIPIIQKEIQNLKYSLTSKGFQMNFRNVIKRPNIIIAPLITSVIKRTAEIEESLISRGYIS